MLSCEVSCLLFLWSHCCFWTLQCTEIHPSMLLSSSMRSLTWKKWLSICKSGKKNTHIVIVESQRCVTSLTIWVRWCSWSKRSLPLAASSSNSSNFCSICMSSSAASGFWPSFPRYKAVSEKMHDLVSSVHELDTGVRVGVRGSAGDKEQGCEKSHTFTKVENDQTLPDRTNIYLLVTLSPGNLCWPLQQILYYTFHQGSALDNENILFFPWKKDTVKADVLTKRIMKECLAQKGVTASSHPYIIAR